MKIIGKHDINNFVGIITRKLRIIVYSSASVLTAISIFLIIYASVIRYFSGLAAGLGACAMIIFFEILMLRSNTKKNNEILTKQRQSAYRFDEFEFGEDSVIYRDFNYYISNAHNIKYETVKKVFFTKDAVYLRFLNHYLAFSRADISETEEGILIDILKNKLPLKKFNPAKIPARNISGCTETVLISERPVVNQFPETAVSYTPSPADVKFALTHNYINGRKTNPLPIIAVWGLLVLLAAVLIFALGDYLGDFLFSIAYILLALAILVTALFSLVAVSNNKAVKNSNNFTWSGVSVTDYFFTFSICYKDGTAMESRYNFASLTGITEFPDYYMIVSTAGFIPVPKTAFADLEIIRMIFAKELGPKYRRFNTK